MFVDYNKETEQVLFSVFNKLTKGVYNDKGNKE